MRVTRQSEIAIGILALYACSPKSRLRTQYLADRPGTTKDHAAHIVAHLVRNGFLTSERSRGGGIRLAVKPDDIALSEVISLTQPEIVRDENGTQLSVIPVAGLDMIVEAPSAFFVRLLDRFTISDLAAKMATDVSPAWTAAYSIPHGCCWGGTSP